MAATQTLFTFPRGWFVVGFSDELAVGEVKPVRYFAQDLVFFRTESGVFQALDAFCPHLGAHLGHGGVVAGETIRCPFHAWQFDGEGTCTDIPYAKKIPPKARLRPWTTLERNGILYMWHDPESGPPDMEIPEIEGYASGEWLTWEHAVIEIKTQCREIVENLADSAHFIPVHGTHIHEFENIYDGATATQLTKGVAYPLSGGEDHFEGDATYHGPSYMVHRMHGVLASIIINAHVPIDEERLELRFAVSLRMPREKAAKAKPFVDGYIDNLRGGYLQDVAIWENKCWRERPALCDGDGPIGKLRRWYRQFYLPRNKAPEAVQGTGT